MLGELKLNILFYFIILLIFILTFIFLRSFKINLIITVFCTFLIFQIILSPKLCIDAAILGTTLFFNRVFPSLFPFLIISSIIISYDGINIYSKLFGTILCRPLRLPTSCSFVIIISILCGYPIGAKYACDLYANNTIDYSTYERLLSIASNASPLFIIGAVGTSMLQNSILGYLLLISNILSCLFMSWVLPYKNSRHITPKINSITFKKNIGLVLKESIDNSIKTTLSIGGFVVIFSVFNSLIKSNIIFDIAINKLSILLKFPKTLIEGSLLGLVEMTNGCFLISSSSAHTIYKFALISFLISFSGLSIISQVYSFTYKFNLSIKTYVIRKFFQGIISSIISLILYKIIYYNISIQTFNSGNNRDDFNIIILCFVLLILPLIFYKIKHLFIKFI